MQNKLYDLVIIGAAAAGSAAAVYAARRNLNFVVVSKDTGGEVALSGIVENWPGIQKISGFELAQNFTKHVKSYNTNIEEGMEVTKIEKKGNRHIVIARNYAGEEKEYVTKSVIIASGIHPRELGIPGEQKLKGKGVTYCTVCDGPLFKGKTTATIGAGNSALESALMMAEISKKVYLISNRPNTPETQGGFPRGETILVEKIKKTNNVEIIYNADTTEILGSDMVEGLKYEDKKTKEKKELRVDGVMVHIGMIPNSKFVTCGGTNEMGEVVVNVRCETDCDGVFAAGDVTNVPFKQIAIAAGHGVTAALSAIDYINKWSE